MQEMTNFPVELSNEELDLVAAGCSHPKEEGSNSGGNFVVQINAVDIGGNQQNANNGSRNSALAFL